MIEALLIFSIMEDFVKVFVPWMLGILGLLAVIVIVVFIAGDWVGSSKDRAQRRERRRQLAYDRNDRVRLRDSALFTALLAQIEEGKLTELYVGPNMACLNFGDLSNVLEADVLDFQKCGWAPISQGHVNQYLLQLLTQARFTPYVRRAKLVWQKLDGKPYLIYGGCYGGSSPGEICPVLKVEYSSRVRRKKGLRSSRHTP